MKFNFSGNIVNMLPLRLLMSFLFLIILSNCSNISSDSDVLGGSSNNCISPPIRNINSSNFDEITTSSAVVIHSTTLGPNNPEASSPWVRVIDVPSNANVKIQGNIGNSQISLSNSFGGGRIGGDFDYENMLANSPSLKRYPCSCVKQRNEIYGNHAADFFQGSNVPSQVTVNEIAAIMSTTGALKQVGGALKGFQNGDSSGFYSVYDQCSGANNATINEPVSYFGYCCSSSYLNNKNFDLVPTSDLIVTDNKSEYSCPVLLTSQWYNATNSSGVKIDGDVITPNTQSNKDVYAYGGRGAAIYVPADGVHDSSDAKDPYLGLYYGKTVSVFNNSDNSNLVDWGSNIVVTIANPIDEFNDDQPQTPAGSYGVPPEPITSSFSNSRKFGAAFITRWTWNGAFGIYWGSYLGMRNGGSHSKGYNYLAGYGGNNGAYSTPIDHHYCSFNPDCSKGNDYYNYIYDQVGARDCQGYNGEDTNNKDVHDYQTNGTFGSCWNISGRGLTATLDGVNYYPVDSESTLKQENIWSPYYPEENNKNSKQFFENITFGSNNTLSNYYNDVNDSSYNLFVDQNIISNLSQLSFKIFNTQINPQYQYNGNLYGYTSNKHKSGKLAVSWGVAANVDSATKLRDSALQNLRDNNNNIIWPMVGGYTIFVRSEPYMFPDSKGNTGLVACIIPEGGNDPNTNAGVTGNINYPYIKNGASVSEQVSIAGCTNPIMLNNSLPDLGIFEQLQNGGTLYLSFVDLGEYNNNQGSYDVNINVKYNNTNNDSLSNILATILHPLTMIINGASTSAMSFVTCDNANCNFSYSRIITSVLTIYIIFYAISFMFGIVEVGQADLVLRIVKIGIIAGLMSPSFVQYITGDVLQAFYKAGQNYMGFIMDSTLSSSGQYGESGFLKQYLKMFDYTIGEIFTSKEFYLQLMSILFSGITGLMIFIMLLYAFIMMIQALIAVVKVSALSYLFIGILILLTPVMLPFMLFQYTKHITEKWFKLILRYSLEPMFIFTGAFMINSMMIVPIISIFDFSVCYKCAIPIYGLGFIQKYIPFINISDIESLLCIPGYLPWSYDNSDGGVVPISIRGVLDSEFTSYAVASLNDVIVFLILASLMKQYVTGLGSLVVGIITGTQGTTVNLSNAVGQRDMIGRHEQEDGNFHGLDFGISDFMQGRGAGNGLFAKMLGIDSNTAQRRKNFASLEDQARLDLAAQTDSSRYANKEEVLAAAANYGNNKRLVGALKEEIKARNEDYKTAVANKSPRAQIDAIAKDIHDKEERVKKIISEEMKNDARRLADYSNADYLAKYATEVKERLGGWSGNKKILAETSDEFHEGFMDDLSILRKELADHVDMSGRDEQSSYKTVQDVQDAFAPLGNAATGFTSLSSMSEFFDEAAVSSLKDAAANLTQQERDELKARAEEAARRFDEMFADGQRVNNQGKKEGGFVFAKYSKEICDLAGVELPSYLAKEREKFATVSVSMASRRARELIKVLA